MSDPAVHDGLGLVRLRPLSTPDVEAWFSLRPGERELAAPGESVVRGAALAERRRDLRTEVVGGPAGAAAVPGGWWTKSPGRLGTRQRTEAGELLFRSRGRWRIAVGDLAEPLAAPVAGIVRDFRPGAGLTLSTAARGLLGADVLGGPSSGRLRILAARDGHVRTAEIDVDSAGAVLVVGSHVDAEALTRARAVGVSGIVVNGLGVKERREVMASEQRARAGLHGLPPFAILVLEGAIGRPIATPLMALLEAIEGRTVALLGEPACLAFDEAELKLPDVPAGLVRVTAGPLAGAEGRWAGLVGAHRFAGGVTLEAGWVRFGGRLPVAVPLGDLERFA